MHARTWIPSSVMAAAPRRSWVNRSIGVSSDYPLAIEAVLPERAFLVVGGMQTLTIRAPGLVGAGLTKRGSCDGRRTFRLHLTAVGASVMAVLGVGTCASRT